MSEDKSEGYTVEVTKSSKGNDVTRYKLNGQLVKASEVPEEVKAELSAPSEEAPVVSEDEIVSADEIDEPEETVEDTNEDEKVETEEEPVPAPVVELDSPDDVDDESGLDVVEQEAAERLSKTLGEDEEGMGFPRKKGKTVDIFDGKTPHTHIRYVSGLVVPLSEENYNTKSDSEIVEKLKKLGKI